jgi:hypothetical protein
MAEQEPSKDKQGLHFSLTQWVDETGDLIIVQGTVTDADGKLVSAEPLFTPKGEIVFGVRYPDSDK